MAYVSIIYPMPFKQKKHIEVQNDYELYVLGMLFRERFYLNRFASHNLICASGV